MRHEDLDAVGFEHISAVVRRLRARVIARMNAGDGDGAGDAHDDLVRAEDRLRTAQGAEARRGRE